MGLHVSAIQQHLGGRASRRGQCDEGALPHALAAPANEAIIERLGWAIGGRRVFPATAGLQHMDDAADHSAIVNPWNAARVGRKIGLKPLTLALVSHNSFVIDPLPIAGDLNRSDAPKEIPFVGPDPTPNRQVCSRASSSECAMADSAWRRQDHFENAWG